MKYPLHLAFLLLCFCVFIHSAAGDESSWNISQERYVITNNFHTGSGVMTFQELVSGGVTVVSHVPGTKQWYEEAAKWGIKVCPYISLYKVAVSGDNIPWESPSQAYPNQLSLEPFWKEIDATKHPEWYLRCEDGQIRRPFDNPKYQTCFQQSCCNHRSMIEAYERGIKNVMDLGAGGVFIDNVHPFQKCFGEKLGLHTHDWPERNNIECYKMALQRAHDVVKSYGKDRVVILNDGARSGQYTPYGDVQMWESWCWVEGCRHDPRSGDELLADYRRWQPFAARGASITALTYLPKPETEAEDAFFACAAAQIIGFEHWTGTCTRRRDILRRLYRVRTGPAVSEPTADGSVVHRQFQNALIACNFDKQSVEFRLAVSPAMGTDLVELYGMCAAPVVEGHVQLILPAESGRIIVRRSDALDNVLREVSGQALAARLHLEKNGAGRDNSDSSTVALMKRLEEIETLAADLRKNIHGADSFAETDRQMLTAIGTLATSPNDSFLAERLDNLRRHADLAVVLTEANAP